MSSVSIHRQFRLRYVLTIIRVREIRIDTRSARSRQMDVLGESINPVQRGTRTRATCIRKQGEKRVLNFFFFTRDRRAYLTSRTFSRDVSKTAFFLNRIWDVWLIEIIVR